MANLQTRKKQTYSASTNTGGKNLITRYNPTAVYGWQAQNISAYNLISDYYERINRGDWISPEEREQYKNAINEYTLSGNKLRDVSKFYGTTYTDEDERSWQNSLSSLNKGYEDINKFYGQFADADQYNSWNTYGNWQRWNDEVMSADRDAYTNYIQVGKNVSNPTWREANKFNQQKVNNMVTFAQANVGRDFAAAAEDLLGLSFNEHADEVQLINSVMTGAEKDRYNYYIGIGDTESAQAYLDYLMPQLENRYWGDFYDFVNDKPVLEPLTNFTSGVLSGVQGIGNFVSGIVGGGEGISPSGIQNVSGQMMANNTGFEKFVNEGIYSVGNMMPSMAIGGAVGEITLGLGASVPMAQMFGQLGGSIYTGMSSAGNSYVEMLGQGYGVDEARKYGLMDGAAEGALQYAIGGIESIGGRLTNHLVKNAIDGIDNGVARFVANTVINMGSEALEEGIQTALEPVFKSIATGEKYEPAKWSDITYSALLGAVTAGVLEGVPRAIETGIGIRQAGKQYGADASGIVTEALNVNPNSKVAQNAQTRIDAGKGVTGTQIYSMLQNIEQGYSKQATTTIKGAVESKLTELGETKNVSKIATAITKQIMGEDLSLTEKNLINKNTNANQVLNEDINTLVQNHKAKQTPTTQATQTASTQSKSGGVVVDTAEGKTTINKVNEDSTVELANGKTVNASDVKIADTNADLVFKTATERIGQTYTNESATAMIKGYESSGVMSAPEFIKAWDEAYNLGKNNNPISQLSVMPNAQTLSETVRTDAYNIGKALANENPAPQRVEGRVTIDKSVDKKSMTADDKAFVKGLDVIAKAFGVNVELYASPVVDGKRQGEQGSYDAKTRTLRVDLYSGNIKTNLNEKLGLYTASHELTHHIKSVAPDSFNKYADALVSALYEGGYNVDELVARQVEKLKSNGRDANLSESELYDRAFEEMVADASERMLADSDAMERLAKEIKSKDKTLWDKIKSYIKKVIDKLKSIYKDLNPQSPEAALIKDMQGKYEELLQIWSDAAVEASRVGELTEDGAELGIEIDAETESIAPTMFSERTWTESEYVVNRDAMAKKIAEALDISVNKAKKYIDDVNSIARMIANDRARLDYEASSFGSAFVSNVEYGGSFDYTTLCKKRRIYTGTFTEIQKVLKDTALSADDILKIRNMLIEEGIEATCGLCYVEGSRANMGKFAKKFIELYKRDNPDAWVPNMADVNTPDGVEKMRINHPEVYEQYEYFWNHYGKLKDSDPALFASQQKPKLYEARKEYKGEILQQFKNDSTITKKNKNGGIRMQSFSDFEIVHLIDTMQVIMDMSTVGLAGQAYTKVPEFALAFGDTGLKINLSLIAKGVDENGKLIFDDREGMPHQTAFDLRNKYSKNVGTIIVTFTDEQLMSAMADDRIDFIIPFHRSQWKKGQYGAMGLPKGTKDYTYMQNEKLIKQTYHEYQGRMVKDKATNYMPNEYWDFSKSGKENAEAYLQMCAENNKRPKFYKLLDYDGEGTYSLKEDGSTDGYWKLLVDFKMYDNDGNGSPQMPVTPNFNMEESTKMLNEYEGGHAQYPVAHGVVDRFVKEYNSSNTIKHSDRTPDDISFTTRSLLADALESTAQNEAEKEKLAEYKGRIDMLNAEEKKLAKLRKQLDESVYVRSIEYNGKKYYAKEFESMVLKQARKDGINKEKITFRSIKDTDKNGKPLDTGKYVAYVRGKEYMVGQKKFVSAETKQSITKLTDEIRATENRINLHDKVLFELEATKPLQDVLSRERASAYKMAAEKGREALHRNVEGRHKTAERNRIRDIAHELDTLLNKGTKKKNVKIGQQDVISKVLDVTDMLFASDDELILNGIKTQVTSAEQSAIDKYKKLYAEYHDTDNAVTEHKEERKAIRHEMDEIKKQFADVLERERQRISNLKASSAFDALIEEYKKLASSDKTYIRDTFDTDTLQMLEQLKEDVGDTTVSNMTLAQLQTIRKALTMMKKMVQNTNKLFKSAKNETIEALGSKAQSEIEKHGHKDKLNKLQKGYASFDWNNLKPIYLLERTDSSVLQELGQAIFDAESDWASDMLEARIFWDKMEAKYNATKWNLDKSYTFTNATGQTYSLTLEQIMSVYAYSKRGKQAIDHLETDGFVFDETTEVKGKGGLKYELNDKTAYKITEPNLIEIVSKLTPEQKSYVDEMQKYLSEVMGAKGNEVSRELYGIDLFGEENYFPIRSEGAYLERVRQQAKGETKIKNKGFTKETQKGARNAIVLSDFSKVWSEHVAEMSSYHTFTLPLEDFYRVYNYQTTSDVNINKQGVIPALENAYGKAATKAIDDLLNDINGGARFDIREQFGKEMLRLYKVGKTMLSLSVVVQQPTSILRAQAMIDPKYFVGEKIGDTKRKELWNELKQYAPVAIIKEMGYFDVGMGRSSADWLTATDYQGWGKVKGFFTDSEYRAEVFSKPASKADELTWVTIWNAVKRETARNNPTLNTSSETFLNMAGKRFEDIIRHTQVYDSTLSRSSYMRNKSVYAQMVTSFMAEPTTSINMREMAMRSKDKNRILRTTAAVYSATLLNALLVALPYAMRDDDEDETFLEKYITAFSTSFIDNINPLTSLPFVKDVWSILQGYDVDRADMTLASDLINSFERFTTACVNQEGFFDNLVSLIGDLSAFTGIPIDNVIRDVKSVINMLKTVEKDKERATTWNSLADALEEAFHDETPVWNWFPGETKSKKLYDALVAGDNKYVARFRSTYNTEEEYYSAVRKSLRDNDPRMREAAQAYLDKNYTVYNQLRDEIVAEGVFNKTLVTDALKAEINYLKRKAEEAEE